MTMIIDATALLKTDDPSTGYNIEPNAPIEIRDSNGNLAIIYSNEALTNPIAQPANCDSNGQFLCYADDGFYNVTISYQSGSVTRPVYSKSKDVRYKALSEAVSEDAPVGTRYIITDMAGARYDVVSSSDSGGLYKTGLASGRKLKLVITDGYIDPKWYGADHTGATESHVEIQTVIDFAANQQIYGTTYATTKYPVILGDGLFKVNPLVIHDGVHFSGRGNSTVLLQNTTGDIIRAMSDTDNNEYYYNVVIKDLYLLGTASKVGYGIRGKGLIRQCKIENVTTENFKTGKFLEKCWTLTLRGGITAFSSAEGIYWDGATSAEFSNYRVDACGSHGVHIKNNLITTETMLISNVKSQFNDLSGIFLNGIRTAKLSSIFLEANCKNVSTGTSWAYLHVVGNSDYGVNITDVFCNKGTNGGDGKAAVYLDKLKNTTVSHLTVQGGIVNGVEISADNESVTINNALLAVSGSKVINSMVDGFFELKEGYKPIKFYGRNFDPSNIDTASLVAGAWNGGSHRGVAIGVNSAKPTIQAFGSGTNKTLSINPDGGNVEVCLGTGNDFHVGAQRKALRRSGSNLTGLKSDNIIGINTDAGTRSYTLVSDQYLAGKILHIKKESASNTLNIVLPTGALDGVAGTTAITDAYGKVRIYCDGVDWWTI